MSIEALNWALNLAPVPDDSSGPSAACAAVLVGLANHADPDGTGAFPSIDTLMRYTRLSERTVRTSLRRLEEFGVIRPCDPALIAARIKRGDRRPNGYDLGLGLVRLDLDDEEIARLSRQFPGLAQRIDAARNGGQQLPPVVEARGATSAPRGATSAARGAVVAPEPSLNHPENHPNTTTSPPADAGEERPKRAGTPTTLKGWVDFTAPSFVEWYSHYPRKEQKKDAETAYAQQVRDGINPEVLLAGVVRFAADPNLPSKDEKRFIPLPASWLRAGSWDDDPLPPRIHSRPGGPRPTQGNRSSAGVTEAEHAEALRAFGGPAQ